MTVCEDAQQGANPLLKLKLISTDLYRLSSMFYRCVSF